jgi:hypothetical protein
MGTAASVPFWLQAADVQDKVQIRLIKRVNNRILGLPARSIFLCDIFLAFLPQGFQFSP